MWIILVCVTLVGRECTSMAAVNGTEAQCRAMMMTATEGRVSCVAPDGTVLLRNESARRR